jgi:hypothetical protein
MEIHQTRDHNSHCYPLPLSAPPRRILGSELQKISSPLDFPAISIKLSGKLHRNRHILALLLRQLGEKSGLSGGGKSLEQKIPIFHGESLKSQGVHVESS